MYVVLFVSMHFRRRHHRKIKRTPSGPEPSARVARKWISVENCRAKRENSVPGKIGCGGGGILVQRKMGHYRPLHFLAFLFTHINGNNFAAMSALCSLIKQTHHENSIIMCIYLQRCKISRALLVRTTYGLNTSYQGQHRRYYKQENVYNLPSFHYLFHRLKIDCERAICVSNVCI